MKETVVFTSEQKAVLRAIFQQFNDNHVAGLFEYDPLEASKFFSDRNEIIDNELDIPGQFKVIGELSDLLSKIGLDIFIKVFKNELDPEKRYVSDALGHGIMLTEESDEEEQERFSIRLSFGSVYVATNVKEIKMLEDMCDDGYQAELIFINSTTYKVRYGREGEAETKTLFYKPLYADTRPQLILQYAKENRVKDEPIGKKVLNECILKPRGATIIGKKESIASSVFSKEVMAIMSYFYDFQPSSIYYIGSIKKNLTKVDINVFRENGINESV